MNNEKEIDRTFLILALFLAAHMYGGSILPVSIEYLLVSLPGTTTYWLSILVAITIAVALVSTVIFGFLSEKLKNKNSKKITLMIAEITVFIPLALAAFAPNFILLLILLSISSFATGAYTPLAYVMVSEFYPPEQRGGKYGQLTFLTIIGGGGGLLFGALFSYFMGPIGWRFNYGLVAFMGLGNVFLYYLYGIEPERGRVEPEFHSFEGAIDYDYKISFEKLKQIFQKKTIAGIMLYTFVSTICMASIGLWQLYYFSQKFGGKNGIILATTLFMLTGLGGLFGSIIGGKLGDRLYKAGKPRARVTLCMLSYMIAYLCLFLYFLVPIMNSNLYQIILSWILLLTIGFIGYVILNLPAGNIGAIYAEICAPEERSPINSVGAIIGGMGGIIGHLMMAFFLLEYSLEISTAIIIFLVIGLLSTLFWVLSFINYPKEAEELRNIMKNRREELERSN